MVCNLSSYGVNRAANSILVRQSKQEGAVSTATALSIFFQDGQVISNIIDQHTTCNIVVCYIGKYGRLARTIVY